MSTIIKASVEDLVRAVEFTDNIDPRVTRRQVQQVVRIAMKKLGLCTLGGRTAIVALGNGYALTVTSQPVEQGAAS